MTPEGKIQKYAKERFEAIGGLVRKLSYEGRSGAPDLLVILPGGMQCAQMVQINRKAFQRRNRVNFRCRHVFSLGITGLAEPPLDTVTVIRGKVKVWKQF